MIDEKKLREKLAKIINKTAYRGLYTFEHDHLINDIVQAVKECEETEETKETEETQETEETEEKPATIPA